MRAMVLDKLMVLKPGSEPLRLAEIPVPEPGKRQLRIKLSVCGVCHTELDEIEGRTPPGFFPMILGHQAVGVVDKLGPSSSNFSLGDRVGVAWIYSACGQCGYCRQGLENLCPEFRATGRDANGGYAEYMIVNEQYAYPVPNFFKDEEAAPLLCAGAVGYRALRLSGIKNGDLLGLTGFGASAHLVLKLVRYTQPDTRIYVFARKAAERDFALELGAIWAGDIDSVPPAKLTAIIDTTPVWKPVLEALKHLKKGGKLVINAIRKEDGDRDELLKLSYKDQLWNEKSVQSVANVTPADVNEFLTWAAGASIRPHVQTYRLDEANEALLDMKFQKIRGAKVLVMN